MKDLMVMLLSAYSGGMIVAVFIPDRTLEASLRGIIACLIITMAVYPLINHDAYVVYIVAGGIAGIISLIIFGNNNVYERCFAVIKQSWFGLDAGGNMGPRIPKSYGKRTLL